LVHEHIDKLLCIKEADLCGISIATAQKEFFKVKPVKRIGTIGPLDLYRGKVNAAIIIIILL